MLKLILEPGGFPVSVDEAKAQARIDVDDEDDLIGDLIAAAVGKLDGPNGLLGRALITQTWDLVLPTFPSAIALPLPPLQSVTSIIYLDANGDSQTLASTVYEVAGIGSNAAGAIYLADGQSWPSTYSHPEAVTVRFVAGYGDAEDVPEEIKTAIRMHVAHLYANRESTTWASSPNVLPHGYETLIADHRLWGFGS